MRLSARRPSSKGRKALLLSSISIAVLGTGGGAYAYASTGSGPSRMDCSQAASGSGEEFTVSRGEVALVRGDATVRIPAGQPGSVGVGETLEVRQGEAVLMLNNVAWRIEAGGTLQVRQGDIVATYKDGKQLTTLRCHRG